MNTTPKLHAKPGRLAMVRAAGTALAVTLAVLLTVLGHGRIIGCILAVLLLAYAGRELSRPRQTETCRHEAEEIRQ